jgi:hypothetical protein
MRTPRGGALIGQVGLVAFVAFFAFGLIVGLLVAMCSARKWVTGVVAQQMVLHLLQEWEQSGHALVEDGRVLGVTGGKTLRDTRKICHCFQKQLEITICRFSLPAAGEMSDAGLRAKHWPYAWSGRITTSSLATEGLEAC